MRVIQLPTVGRQKIIHQHLDPLAKPPEGEAEHAAVEPALEPLLSGHHVVKQLPGVRESGDGRNEPAVTDPPLRHVRATHAAREELGISTDILRIEQRSEEGRALGTSVLLFFSLWSFFSSLYHRLMSKSEDWNPPRHTPLRCCPVGLHLQWSGCEFT